MPLPPSLTLPLLPTAGDVDNQMVMRLSMQERDDFREMQRSMASSSVDDRSWMIKAPTVTSTKDRFIAIDASHRDVSAYPYRYKYTVHMSDMGQGTHRNIEWMSATSIVLPMEIVQSTNTIYPTTKPFYNHEFSFAYPYVLLAIEGFDNVYDGTSGAIRSAFCMFVYHRSYKAPNGRGYILLKPAQGERKFFSPPLASLRDLTVSILKPNGGLINNSMDTVTARLFQYESQYRLLIKVVCNIYFDLNEYHPGDVVFFRGFDMKPPDDMFSDHTRRFVDFVNRARGHEIVQLGGANDQGFYKSFYVLAPGILDQGAGRIIIDDKLISVVNTLTETPTLATAAGRIVNTSLQNVVTLKVGVSTASMLSSA